MRKSFLLAILFIAPFLTLAQNGYFIPNPLILPVHAQKNELNLSIGVGKGFDGNVSYSLTNKFAVFATGLSNEGTFHRDQIMGSGYNVIIDNQSYSGGFIYFLKLKKKYYFESALGYGKFSTSNFRNFDTDSPTITISNYWNIFNQLSISKSIGNHEFGIANRLSYNKYNNFEVLHFYSNSRDVYENLYTLNIEPVLNLNYNVKRLKIGLQMGVSIPVSTNYKNIKIYDLSSDFEKPYAQSSDDLSFLSYIARLSLQYSFDLSSKK